MTVFITTSLIAWPETIITDGHVARWEFGKHYYEVYGVPASPTKETRETLRELRLELLRQGWGPP